LSETGFIVVIEPTTPFFKCLFNVKKVYAVERSEFQEVALLELEGFGKALVIDKLVQSTETDEYLYHESLVHPAMILHPEPKRVLIIGGGEGAALREVLKHNTVEKAVMVDIDKVVVEFSKKYLDFIHKGSFNDPRAETVIMDGFKYIKNVENSSFDVVIMDLTDPYASEIAKPVYSLESMKEIYRILSSEGVLATQAGNSFFYNKSYNYVLRNVKEVFKYTAEYWVWIPSFGYACNFIIGSKVYNPLDIEPEVFNTRLRTRGVETRFINGERYFGLIKLRIVMGDLENRDKN